MSLFLKKGIKKAHYSREDIILKEIRRYSILKTHHSKIVEIKLLIFTSPAIVGRVKLDHNSKQQNASERRANNY